MQDSNEMTSLLKQLRDNEITTAKKLAMEGIKEGLSHLGLSITSRDIFLEMITTGKSTATIEQAADKVVVNKLSDVSSLTATLNEVTPVTTVHEQIAYCDKSKDKLEALGLWVYDIDLKKNKSFDNMAQDLIQHVENKE